jgi:hypothetical protein
MTKTPMNAETGSIQSISKVECYIPQNEHEIQTLEELNKMLETHDWVFSHSEKWGNGLLFFVSCERCDLKRVLTMISTGIQADRKTLF